jgi:hypothetical protein
MITKAPVLISSAAPRVIHALTSKNWAPAKDKSVAPPLTKVTEKDFTL